jgi:heavy metal efflux system protein
VALREIANVKVLDGPVQISRESGKRRIVVGSNVSGRDIGSYVEEAQERIDAEVKLPEGYFIQWGGQFENMERATKRLTIIVPVTILAIFFLLFTLFNSLRYATLIITVLPFASIGGIIALFVTGEYLSVPASVGFIALWGIAVLNGVVLVSYIRVSAPGRPGTGRRHPAGLRHAVPSGADDGDGRDAGPDSVPVRDRPRIRSAAPARHRRDRRPHHVDLLTLVVVPTLYRWFEGKGPVT